MSVLVYCVELTLAHLVWLDLPWLVLLRALSGSMVLVKIAWLSTTREVVFLRVADVLSTVWRWWVVKGPEARPSSSGSLAMTLSIRSCHRHTRVVSTSVLDCINWWDGNVHRPLRIGNNALCIWISVTIIWLVLCSHGFFWRLDVVDWVEELGW